MFDLQGKNGLATVFTDNIDEKTIGQIITMLNDPITENTTVRIMPDTHFGAGATIGTTIKLSDNKDEWKIAPQVVGVDLSCGMMSYRIKEKDIDLAKLDTVVNSVVPAGSRIHAKPQHSKDVEFMINQLTYDIPQKDHHYKSLGTLGGGNHFIELAKDETGDYWLTVHSGSRSFGAEIAKHHEKVAKNYQYDNSDKIKAFLDDLKAKGAHKNIQSKLKAFKAELAKTPKHNAILPYLEGKLLNNYLHDIAVADEYAHLSRKTMLDNIVKEMGWTVDFEFDSVHNNIDQNSNTIRKGATSARKGELLIIPLNMRDGSLICVGKGNDDWNQSAPHGAGRVLSRSQARNQLDFNVYKEQMDGIYTSSVTESTIDEAPDVYKPAEEIEALIKDTVEVKHHLKPVYNFKAH